MRPVDRKSCPKDALGQDLVFAEYGHARPHLIERIGDYCSFCETRLPNPSVEHIRHKSGNPALERAWTNLLFACPSCNSTKGVTVDTEEDLARHLWPDRDQSYRAFVYGPGGVVSVATTGDAEELARARATEALVGLTRRPGFGLTHDQLLRRSDRRWELRREAWQMAMDARADLAKNPTPELRRSIVNNAKSQGFWSIWVTVFADDPELCRALCEAFCGTAIDRIAPLTLT